MCGVVGLIYERARDDLGRIAGQLLETLEYRGYDSTGAAIQGAGVSVTLRKGVGAPSALIHKLGIVDLPGQVFCGQVRWATFGAVTEENAQPHVVDCKTFLYGAHNGNVTNCDELEAWLKAQGHVVRSNNDGEMVVHIVEHLFAEALTRLPEGERQRGEARRSAMRGAISEAATRLRGSFAAVIVDPVTRVLYAMKLGSSLYFGLGSDEVGGRFCVASSDLSSVLKLTRTILPLSEGELLEFTPEGFTLFALGRKERALTKLTREPVRSRLRTEETGLNPPFKTFMEQEIAAQQRTLELLVEQFAGTGPTEAPVSPASPTSPSLEDEREAREEERELASAVARFAELFAQAQERGRRVYVLCCGTSFHAAKLGALFFNEVAHAELLPYLPGEFRAQVARSLADGDVLVALSQSGETKDVIDVLNDVIAEGKAIARVAIVNNVNSTLGQEKCQLVIPLRCGPEIAVPATKSFINQVGLLLGLAITVARRRLERASPPAEERAALQRELAGRVAHFRALPALVRQTTEETRAQVEEAARLLYLRPSIHVLATRMIAVAKEGALKIREVVLNHTEGFECSEFKHGPNTLLGVNTVYGIEQLERTLERLGEQGVLPVAERGAFLSSLSTDYPLVYVTGPDERDVALTISAINTHKIRGAQTFVIAEENEALRSAATRPPADSPGYRSIYIPLPRTGDTLSVAFTATIVLQQLALRMSLLKAAHLDRLGLVGHGVHPDVPKNVSKSITVD